MTTMMRRHGATMIERNGRSVAAHFGSPASEAAVCRSRVGLAERSDRATLEVTGDPAGVDQALEELAQLGDTAWWVRRSPHRAIVRCDGAAADGSISVMLRAEDVNVVDVSADHAAVDLIGPRAHDVLDAHQALQEGAPVVLVVRKNEECVELLVRRAYGPALWNTLLAVGEPHGIACVGLEALEHLDVSERVSGRRRRA
jgi:glycine cleavage system aminomethyltransferase T